MNTFLVWNGSDIGHGQRGGTITIGSRTFCVGQQIPVDIINPESLKTLKASGALTEPKTAELVGQSSGCQTELNETQQKQYDEILINIDDEILILEALEAKVQSSNNALDESNESIIGQVNASYSDLDEIAQHHTAIKKLVEAHAENFENSEASLKSLTVSLNEKTTGLKEAKKALKTFTTKITKANKESDIEQTDEQSKDIEDFENLIESLNTDIKQIEKDKITEKVKFDSSSDLLESAKKELEEDESESQKTIDKNETTLKELKAKNTDLEARKIEAENEVLAQKQKIETLKNSLTEMLEQK